MTFIDVDDLSAYLGRDVGDDDGAVICVDSACSMVQTLTEQDFEAATDTVSLDGTGTDTVLLPQVPVSAAGTVVVNGAELLPTDYGVQRGRAADPHRGHGGLVDLGPAIRTQRLLAAGPRQHRRSPTSTAMPQTSPQTCARWR